MINIIPNKIEKISLIVGVQKLSLLNLNFLFLSIRKLIIPKEIKIIPKYNVIYKLLKNF